MWASTTTIVLAYNTNSNHKQKNLNNHFDFKKIILEKIIT